MSECEHGQLKRVCVMCELRDENIALREQLEAAQADAGRYRWLRKQECAWEVAHYVPMEGRASLMLDELDAEIDEDIAARQEPQSQRCEAFDARYGETCMWNADHDGPHAFPSDVAGKESQP